MAKAKKATIKFQKNHLKGAIEQRRKKQKATQIYKKRNPKKFGRGANAGSSSNGGEEQEGEDAEQEEEEAHESGDEKYVFHTCDLSLLLN
jgi:nucleolar complex protein 2